MAPSPAQCPPIGLIGISLLCHVPAGVLAAGFFFTALDGNCSATFGAAVFGPWSTITASVLASWWARTLPAPDEPRIELSAPLLSDPK